MNLKFYASLLVVVYTSFQSSYSQIIPDERRIQWNPGIPGGISSIESPVVNVLNYGADPTGLTNSYASFLQAINTLPASGGVVFIPEGNYRIDSKLKIVKNNVVLKGEGTNKSKIQCSINDNSVEVVTYQRGNWQNLQNGYNLHSTKVTVEDGTLFTVGEFAEIQQENDSAIMYTNPLWIQSWAESSVGQILEIEAINGNELTFKNAIHFNFNLDQNPVIRPQNLIKNVGFEDFYIEKTTAGGHTFFFQNAAYCWLKNIESYHTRKSHVNLTTTLGIEIRNSFFHRSFDYGDGGSGYGVECAYHTTDCLIENNVFDSLRHAMMVHLGSNGNVFGYNYSIHPVQGAGENNLNQGWTPPDISIHGHYAYMNLFEGNNVCEIGIGDYWGPAGLGNTYFRNQITNEGIFYYDNSDFQNLIGNTTPDISNEEGSSEFMLEHGNIVSNIVYWNDTIAEHTLPESYYLNVKPDFFTDYNWPTFGPGCDINNKLPAQGWYENRPLANAIFNLYLTEAEFGFSVYPNPAKENITIYYTNLEPGKSSILIYDISGILLKAIIVLENKGAIQFNAFQPGVYFVVMSNGDKTIRKQINFIE